MVVAAHKNNTEYEYCTHSVLSTKLETQSGNFFVRLFLEIGGLFLQGTEKYLAEPISIVKTLYHDVNTITT